MEELMAVDSMGFDHYARYSYEKFIFNQPQIKTKGLYFDYPNYYIVCPELREDTLALDGCSTIIDWLEHNRVISCPIELVNEIPCGSIKIAERTIEQVIYGSGNPKTKRDVWASLILLLPLDFPKITLTGSNEPCTVVVLVERNLTIIEQFILEEALLKLELPIQYKVMVDTSIVSNKETFRYKFGQGDISIIPAKLFPFTPSNNLKKLAESDDDFWATYRIPIFTGKINCQNEVIPDAWDKFESRCLINSSVFQQYNIRNYLSIYQNIIIAPPIKERQEEVLNLLGVTVEELTQLAEMGKVRIILPQSLDRYSLSLLEALAEAAPESLILSHRLAATTIIDTRRRFPFLYPPWGVKEKVEVLHTLYHALNDSRDPILRRTIEPVLLELSRIWSVAEELINDRGAMATSTLGLGGLTAAILKSFFGMDRFLEFYSAATTVEWAAPFTANVSPISINESYSEESYVQILANSYSGFANGEYPLFMRQTSKIIEGILSIDSDVPVVEFAESFGNGDIERLRRTIFEITNNNTIPDNLDDLIRNFNAEVRKHESRINRIAKWEISGFIKDGLGLLGALQIPENPELGYTLATLPLASRFYKVLDNHRSDSEFIGEILDGFSAFFMRTQPGAVLVARLKKNLRSH